MAFNPDVYLAEKTGGFNPDAYLAEKTGANPAAQPEPVQAKPATLLERFRASQPMRVMQGMRDPIDEAAVLLPKGLQAVTSLGGNFDNPVSDFFGNEASRVQGMNKQGEAEYQAARAATGQEGSDNYRFAGNMASPVNIAVASKIPTALRGIQAVKAGIGAGAVGGALSPGVDANSENYWKEKAIETGKGAAIGAGTSGIIAGAARIIRPETRQAAKDLIKAGVTPTAGQILGGTAQKVENKLQSLPIMGDMITGGQRSAVVDFNKAALKRALDPIGESVDDVGRAGMQQVKEKLSAAYNSLLPKISFKPDAQFRHEMSNLQTLAKGLGDKEQSKFNAILSDVMSKASPNGSMTGETFKIVESKINTEAKKFAGSTDAYQKELGDALNEALRIMRDTLPRVNPESAKRLKAINEGYANFARLRQAASSTATGANDGIFTPAQLAMAVKAMDKSAGKGASATGNALMQDLAEAGTNVLSSKVADSGTAGRVLLGGGAIGAGAFNPLIPVGLGVAGLPFMGAGKKITAAALTNRGSGNTANRLAELVRKTNPLVAGGLPLALNDRN